MTRLDFRITVTDDTHTHIVQAAEMLSVQHIWPEIVSVGVFSVRPICIRHLIVGLH